MRLKQCRPQGNVLAATTRWRQYQPQGDVNTWATCPKKYRPLRNVPTPKMYPKQIRPLGDIPILTVCLKLGFSTQLGSRGPDGSLRPPEAATRRDCNRRRLLGCGAQRRGGQKLPGSRDTPLDDPERLQVIPKNKTCHFLRTHDVFYILCWL